MKYCHLCGATNIEGKSQPWECSGCHNLRYKNASPTVDILLFNEKGEVLIAERAIEPAKGKFDFPGGFVEEHETLEEGLKREIQEELGLNPEEYTQPIYQSSQSVKYDFSKENRSILSTIFAAKLKKKRKIVANDDVASVRFVSMEELSGVNFSLNSYPSIAKKAYKQFFS